MSLYVLQANKAPLLLNKKKIQKFL